MPEIRVEPVTTEQLDQLLPLIAAYQRFYEVDDIDEGRNRAFFAHGPPPLRLDRRRKRARDRVRVAPLTVLSAGIYASIWRISHSGTVIRLLANG
jgi:hypothetical protein